MSEQDQKTITQIFVNIGKSLAAYQNLLKPASSRFDRYVSAVLANDEATQRNLYSTEEANGLMLFISKGSCIMCHSGPMFSDFEFHHIAVPDKENGIRDAGRYIGAEQVLKSEFNCFSEYNDSQQKKCLELDFLVTDILDPLIGIG